MSATSMPCRVLPGDLVAQEPFTAWLRRGTARDRIHAAPKLFGPTGAGEAIRVQSAARFGRPRHVIEQQRQQSSSVARLCPRPSRLPALRRLRRP